MITAHHFSIYETLVQFFYANLYTDWLVEKKDGGYTTQIWRSKSKRSGQLMVWIPRVEKEFQAIYCAIVLSSKVVMSKPLTMVLMWPRKSIHTYTCAKSAIYKRNDICYMTSLSFSFSFAFTWLIQLTFPFFMRLWSQC